MAGSPGEERASERARESHMRKFSDYHFKGLGCSDIQDDHVPDSASLGILDQPQIPGAADRGRSQVQGAKSGGAGWSHPNPEGGGSAQENIGGTPATSKEGDGSDNTAPYQVSGVAAPVHCSHRVPN